jgi:hypothetical protein
MYSAEFFSRLSATSGATNREYLFDLDYGATQALPPIHVEDTDRPHLAHKILDPGAGPETHAHNARAASRSVLT